jgi:type VI secretion system secreted protein Hcp
MWIKGERTGWIRGSVGQKGREGSIRVISLDYDITQPIDVASGNMTGRRKHSDIVLIKEIENSTTFLYNALSNHERLEVEFRLSRGEVPLQSIKLSNCFLLSINLFSVPTVPTNKIMAFDQYEKISFNYSTMEILSPVGTGYSQQNWQTGFSDTWETKGEKGANY